MTNQKEGRLVVLAGIIVMATLIVLFGNALSWSADKVFNMTPTQSRIEVKSRGLNSVLKSDSSDFCLKAWGDECEMKIMAPQSKGKLKLYTLEGGNLEWEIVLASKPASNVFSYSIQTKGLKYCYQPELTQQEIDWGTERPDSVVGSYAVYHKTMRGNYHYPDGSVDEYKTGKAFHIYRPKAIDKDKKTSWCDLYIDTVNNMMHITVPQAYLNDVVYPLSIDPQFGKTDIGGSNNLFDDYINAGKHTMGGSAGTLDSIVPYINLQTGSETPTIYVAIYTDNAGEPDVLGEEETNGVLVSADGWPQIPMAGTYNLSASTAYWLAKRDLDGDAEAYRIHHDTDGNGMRYKHLNGTSLFEDPFTSSPTSQAWSMSIYGVYTVTAAAASTRRSKVIRGGN